MRSICGYAILEECKESGSQYWVRIGGPNSTTMIAASCGLPSELYADGATAEHDAEILRRRNTRDVERTRWQTFRMEPATYTVIEIAPWVDAEGIGEAGWATAGEGRESSAAGRIYAPRLGVALPGSPS